jgi:SAM-dependent methyltransferase
MNTSTAEPRTLPDTHLDLGCGKFPRNPYRRSALCGTDIRAIPGSAGFEFRAANLALEPIPWADHSFASVSGFDFIEHVPRLLTTADGRATRFPFVELMDEIWRVLAPGGCLYAVTPAYPSPESFQDPTHVNIITERTHDYFCGESPLGRIYGFKGRFIARRAEWVRLQDAFDARPVDQRATGSAPRPKVRPLHKRFADAVRQAGRRARGHNVSPPPKAVAERPVYFLWELEAVKPRGDL